MEDLIYKYFPALPETAAARIKQLYPLYEEWNGKINVISRKDIDQLYLHHVLHSLAIARYIQFPAGSKIMDVGTGGGFPGIPLAILFPECSFTLVDSIGKKIKVVEEISKALKLENVTAIKARAEEVNGTFDYVVSRAVTDLKYFLPWVKGKYTQGIIYLKGGDITPNEEFSCRGALLQEIDSAAKLNGIKKEYITIQDISRYFSEEYFIEKRIIHLRKKGSAAF